MKLRGVDARVVGHPGQQVKTTERRAAHRYRLVLSVVLRRTSNRGQNKVFNGETHDISTGGICFTTDEAFTINEIVDFSIAFEHPIDCHGIIIFNGRLRVLRLVDGPGVEPGRIGIAGVIDRFQFHRDTHLKL